MRLIPPIKDIGGEPINYGGWQVFISQKFGNVWISQIDQTIAGKVIKKGDNVYLKLFGMIGHNGVDIAAPKGTPIYASHDGFIVEATTGTSYGTRVALYFQDGGKEWLLIHGHLDNHKPLPVIPWKIKDKTHPVKQGDKIGEVDSTGFSNGHHLHWGLYEYKNGVKLNNNNGYFGAIDPWQYVKGDTMQLIKDQGVVYLVAGVNNKVKLGIADMETVALFGDEPITETGTSEIPETYTISKGFILNKK